VPLPKAYLEKIYSDPDLTTISYKTILYFLQELHYRSFKNIQKEYIKIELIELLSNKFNVCKKSIRTALNYLNDKKYIHTQETGKAIKRITISLNPELLDYIDSNIKIGE
jgi:hypothetical protein